ncbi:MAG: T9SS type A sorting domain-containing protein [candidate division WOR-3 bacterium]
MNLFYVTLLLCGLEGDEKALREKGLWQTDQEAIPQNINPGVPWAGPQGIITWNFEASDGGFVAPPDWFCTGGWGWDDPSNGPGAAHSGLYCWGTSPDGPSYGPNANWTLTMPAQNFSTLTSPILKFWHWYETESSYDTCRLEISTNRGGSWTELAKWAGYGTSWQEVSVSLSAYAGRPSVMIRWRLTSDSSVQYDGWFIDDVRILNGPTGATNLYATSFEGGGNPGDLSPVTIGGGAAPWQRGQPNYASGPASAYDGTLCWGTNLTGDYNNSADEAIQKGTSINASGYSYLEINFWQWYSTETSYDSGWVEVSTDNGSTWLKASPSYRGTSAGWVKTTLDISSYASSQFKFRFRFKSDFSIVYPGWYVDSVRITGGTLTTVRSWDFEADSGNFAANPAATRTNKNEWAWGAPPGVIGAHSGSRCWGTDLSGTYENSAVMVLRAPVQNVSAWPRVIIDFWHWRDAETADTSIVEVSSDGGVTWNRVATYTATFRYWRAETLNVSAYKSANFTFRFVLKTDAFTADTGWYIDDVELDTIPPTMVPITWSPIKVSQGYVACYIENTTTDGYGTITAATDTLHPRGPDISLLFAGAAHNPWSSYLTIRSYRSNTDFVTRYSGCTTQAGYSVAQMDPYFVGSYMIKGNEDSVVTVWNLPDNLRAEQHIYALGNNVADARIQVMTYVINTHASQNRTVSVRYEWDIHIFDTDAPYIRAYKTTGWSGWYGSEKHWWGDSMGLYYEENQNPILGTPLWHYISCKWSPWPPDPLDPDTFYFVRWPLAWGSAFPVNYMADGRDSLARYNDDCVVFMWVNKTIGPGDTLKVVEYLWSPNQPLYENVEEPGLPGKPFVGLAGPNPARPGDALWFGISRDQVVDLKIYSVDGRLVKTLISGKREAGTHAIILPRLPSGTYFLIMDAEADGRFSRKLLVNK